MLKQELIDRLKRLRSVAEAQLDVHRVEGTDGSMERGKIQAYTTAIQLLKED